MCGIAGFTGPGSEAGGVLRAMNQALAHRGPDGSGTFVDSAIALGHTRLAIIDLAGGAQPRVDRTTGDALVFNGEIYGYRALADALRAAGVALCDRSDTEGLFQLIRRPAFCDAELDRLAAVGFFLFEYLPRVGAGWVGIERLEPGTILTWHDGRIAVERYWQPPLEQRAVGLDEATERLDELLRGSGGRPKIAHIPGGGFLSGGGGSRLITP